MLAKQLEYLAGATGSGIVLGARIPIALTSRADGPQARVASALLALLIVQHNRKLHAAAPRSVPTPPPAGAAPANTETQRQRA